MPGEVKRFYYMAPGKTKKVLLISAVVLFLYANTAVTLNVIQNHRTLDPDCTCQPVLKDFNEMINDQTSSQCPKCYYFEYQLHEEQDWASNVCIQKLKADNPAPLFVVVHQSLDVTSFQVPVIFPGVSPYLDICKTLCPLANYNHLGQLKPGPQNITIEISTSSVEKMDFSLTLSNISNFIISDDAPLTVNITPTKPRVMQYNMKKHLRAVRIEAMSKDDSCMILAIQALQCPIYDSVEAFEPQGYHQTLTRQSGISITQKTFKGGRQYVVLLLKPTDEGCIEGDKEIIPLNRQKEVTVSVTPSITDAEYYQAIFGAIGFYVLIYLFSFIICCFIRVRQRRATETQKIGSEDIAMRTSNAVINSNISSQHDVENPTIQNYGTSDSESERSNTTRSLKDYPVPSLNGSPISFDETDIDRLPDIEHDKNIVRTKTVVYVSDLSRKNDKYLSERSKVYSWNLLTIAIFYGLPVVQLVYINQRIVNSTGNQDLCYYNFLCSHQVGVFSDFNHIYSNIGYVMLGILFLLLVWRREALDCPYENEKNIPASEMTGIPRHYGLMYAMGWALVMEGVLSGSYHVCPNRANFQFDTAFMYVISTVCMLKLYQSRHADIIAKSHTTWMVLAVVIVIGFGGVLKGGIYVWLLYIVAHFTVMFVVSAKIYYMGRWKMDRWIFKRIRQNIKLDIASRAWRPIYLDRFIMLTVAVLVNFSLDMFGIIKQPPNFGAFLLSVFIANLLMYLIYYSFMKIKFKEGIRWIPIMYMVFSFACWGAALYFFLAKNTSWQVTPAESREKNKHCIILNFFDHHDVWHFLSSCALFFSFMVLFTLDDDLVNTPRSKIIVF